MFSGRSRRVQRVLRAGAYASSLLGLACSNRGMPPAAVPAGTGLTIRLMSVPARPATGAAIYVAGTFNNWDPAAAGYRLTARGRGRYAITLPDSVRGPVEFKFTLGSWERVELSASGGDVPNRTFTVPPSGAAVYTGTVAAWRDSSRAPRPSTSTASVSILSTELPIPQLGRTRRVWLYLPPDYATSSKTYPVLYMQDGQNVFDRATSFAGEWGVDETLDSLHAAGDWGVIVVAIDNGGANRLREYSPWPSAIGRVDHGEGSQYVDFLAQTLKPYIDAHYRTQPDRSSTGVAGSSLGGLLAFYAALKYPEVFGRVLALSPSFFLTPEIFALAGATRPQRPGSRFYFDSGLNEGGTGALERAFARAQRAMVDTLAASGVDTAADVRSLLPADGAHAEWFWRREFAAAYQWLFRRGQ